MKHSFSRTRFRPLPCAAALALALPALATASAVMVETFHFNALAAAIPDGNPAGLANVQNLSSTVTQIDSVTVGLDIVGTFNGDLYAYLAHDSGFSVLLNRSGRSPGDAFGYADSGFDVTFDDGAADDIHSYRLQGIPAPGTPLTGVWQPDARAVDPDLVVDASPRSAFLADFIGLDANGDWTLFLADLSGGDPHTLESWSLEITGVPEPGTLPLVVATALAALAVRRRRSGRS